MRLHAQILLKADQGAGGPGWTDRRIAEAYGATVLLEIVESLGRETLRKTLK